MFFESENVMKFDQNMIQKSKVQPQNLYFLEDPGLQQLFSQNVLVGASEVQPRDHPERSGECPEMEIWSSRLLLSI